MCVELYHSHGGNVVVIVVKVIGATLAIARV